jgi:RNA polymerase sigma-70 factor, ECF subfamily
LTDLTINKSPFFNLKIINILEAYISHNSDDTLILLIKNRQEQGVSMLYDKYSKALFNAILQVVRAKDIAEEVLQDTFIKVWRNIDSYNVEKGRLYTWLFNIARNTAIDATRSKNFKQKNDHLDASESTENQPTTAINTDTIGVEKLTELLSPEHKIVIDLIYFQGFTQAEVSIYLDIPLGTIKTRVRTAIKILRHCFNPPL